MSNKKRAKGGAAHRRRRRPASSTAARSSSTPAIETPAQPATRTSAPPRARRSPRAATAAGEPASALAAAPDASVAAAVDAAPAAGTVAVDAEQDAAAPLVAATETPPAVADAVPSGLPLDPAPVSGSRVRRTRTLADVVQPEYPAAPEDEAAVDAAPPAEAERRMERATPSSLPRIAATTGPLAETTEPPSAAPPDPPRAAPSGPPRTPPSGPLTARPSGPSRPAPSTPLPAAPPPRVPATTAHLAADDPLRTVPFPRRPIPRPHRAPLAGPEDSEAGAAPVAAPAAPPSPPLAARLLWSIQRGSPRLVLTAALGHVCVGLGLAVAASIVLLVSGGQGYQLLAIAAIALGGGIAGYALVAVNRPTWTGALAMVVAQLAVLALVFSAIGPQVGVLMFAPAAAYLAQRMGGRTVAIVSGAGAVMVYLVFVIASLIQPAPAIQPTALLFFNLFAAIAGIGLLLVSLITVATARERSEAAARARLYELRLLRARMAELRERTEGDARLLEEALTAALRGRGIEPVAAEGALSPVAEVVNDVADRLATLQKDREDRLRVEGAVRAVVRAVERGWLGLPWAWPEPSGTLLDQLVAYLRTPRPREQATPLPWGDETPTIVPKPTRSANSRPLEPRSDPNIARVFSAVDEQWDPWSGR